MGGGLPLEPFLLPSRRERLSRDVERRTRSLTVVMDGVHDPHNLGAVLRSCEAFGLLEMHVVESHARYRISGKVTQGAEKWVEVHRYPDPAACVRALQKRGFGLWVADFRPDSVRVNDLPYGDPLALVFGNEHAGVSEQMVQRARGCFHIPMYGFTQSFNVSVSAGVALAAAVRERERRPQGHADLGEEERAVLKAEWQRRSVKHAERILARLANQGASDGR